MNKYKEAVELAPSMVKKISIQPHECSDVAVALLQADELLREAPTILYRHCDETEHKDVADWLAKYKEMTEE